jgi:hypothetical protein
VLLAILAVVTSRACPVALAADVLEAVDGRSLAIELVQKKGAAARDATLHAVEVRLTMYKPL